MTTTARDARFDAMIRKLRQAMADSGTNANQLAKALGRDSSYVYNLLSGKKKSVAAGDMLQIERLVGLPAGTLSEIVAPHGAIASEAGRANPRQNAARKIAFSPSVGMATPRKVGIYGKVNYETGGIVMDEAVDQIALPEELAQAADLFGCYMPDDSMLPRYAPGEALLMNPHKPITPGCFVFIQIKTDGPPEGFVRQFVSRGAAGVTARTLNPEKTHVFKTQDIVSVARVVLSREP